MGRARIPASVRFSGHELRALGAAYGWSGREGVLEVTESVLLDDEGHLRRGVVAGISTRPGPEIGCGWRIDPGRTARIPLELPVYTGYFTVALHYGAVGPTPVRGGLTYREAHLALELVSESELVGSLEVVEVNPILDRANTTAETAVELVASALGKTIL